MRKASKKLENISGNIGKLEKFVSTAIWKPWKRLWRIFVKLIFRFSLSAKKEKKEKRRNQDWRAVTYRERPVVRPCLRSTNWLRCMARKRTIWARAIRTTEISSRGVSNITKLTRLSWNTTRRSLPLPESLPLTPGRWGRGTDTDASRLYFLPFSTKDSS